jgi:hypothetical protein
VTPHAYLSVACDASYHVAGRCCAKSVWQHTSIQRVSPVLCIRPEKMRTDVNEIKNKIKDALPVVFESELPNGRQTNFQQEKDNNDSSRIEKRPKRS